MWDTEVTLETVRERDARSHFMGKKIGAYLLAQTYAGYPVSYTDHRWLIGSFAVGPHYTYPQDQYYDRFPRETKSNVLVMNGLLVRVACCQRHALALSHSDVSCHLESN